MSCAYSWRRLLAAAGKQAGTCQVVSGVAWLMTLRCPSGCPPAVRSEAGAEAGLPNAHDFQYRPQHVIACNRPVMAATVM